MDMIKKVRILRVEGGVRSEIEDAVATEHKLAVYVNGSFKTELTCSPENLPELVLGNLLSTGMIGKLADVRELIVDEGGETARVETVCDCVRPYPAADALRVSSARILSAMERFMRESAVFFATGAVHSCALLVGGQLLHFTEDIGRHNAFDKTIGAALRHEIPLEQSVVLTSGRLPKDMVEKAVYSRVQAVVSRSAPTDSAIELALANDMTLCGFARGDRLNIYTGMHRILF